MRRHVLIFTALSLPLPLGAQRGSVSDTTTRVVDRVFEAYSGTNSPGCALGVSRNGRVVYERGYGMANLETGTPITPASIFHVASVSKQFTAMSIMLLARDGKLSVDDDIRKYLPEIPSYGTTITIRNLLTHTSGIRDQWNLIALARGRFEEDRITEADVMDILSRQTALNFTPGAEYLYSNSGFTLLGVIVKRESGKSLRDFADERIFKPLGMTSTHFHDDYAMLVPGRTSAYAMRGGSWHVSIPNFDTYGATSLYTTVGDLLKWEANLDNPTVGDGAIVARMEAPTILTGGDTSTYGFGLVAERYRGARVVGHNGADAGYRSAAERFPELGLAIVVFCNFAAANPTLLGRRVAEAYLGSALAPAQTAVAQQAEAPEVTISPDKLRARAGMYLDTRTMQVSQLTFRDGKLMVGAQGNQALVPISENRMRTPGPAAATPQLLASYAGEYISDELGGSIKHIVATDSTLIVQSGPGTSFPLRLAFADTFVGAGYTVQFARTRGQLTGFDVTDGRIRHVKFVKRKSP
jgi:CubicO group peptidase (beta-lactamase class C family)